MKFTKLRKIIVMLLATAMTLGVVACGNGEGETSTNNSTVETGAGVENSETNVQESTEPVADNSGETEKEPAKTYEGMRTELTSLEFVELMGNGINLGNTMEAYGRQSFGVGATTAAYETFWGQPVTTQEMVSGMKAAGFDTIRIPVAWTNAMEYEKGDYTIGADYLDRVEEIVNYALNEDMYVIINDHWDGGWWGMFGSATEATRNAAMDLYVSMWTQIGERFKNYSDHVIFESGNEELGFRLNDKDVAADSGSLSDEECYTVTNQINQKFVDTIRGLGGNNEVRFLLIAGFGTDITNTCNDMYKMPTDTADSKLLLSVHYYDPSGYCIWTSQATWGTKRDYQDQADMLSKLNKFIDQGYGIVIGEYGVLMNNKVMKENTLEYTQAFLNNCDILQGICPVLWDCNDMYNRNDCKIVDQGMADLFTAHSYAVQSTQNKEDLIAKAKAENEAAMAAAPEAAGVDDRTAKAWIMYTSSDWGVQYSVGDTYDPGAITAGVVATDVEITGAGTYTVSLDFTGLPAGYASGMTFSALGIANGEALYPGYIVNITEVLVNGEVYKLTGRPYTCSDDGLCTRVNLYNAWVTAVDTSKARVMGGGTVGLTPTVMDGENIGNIESISVTFNYVEGK